MWRRSKPGVLRFAGLIPVVTAFFTGSGDCGYPGARYVRSTLGSGFLLEHHDPFVFYSTSVESLLLNF